MNAITDETIAEAISALLASRDASASICPSEVARALVPGTGWRALMPRVRSAAATMVASGALKVTRGAKSVSALSRGGPIRLRRPAR